MTQNRPSEKNLIQRAVLAAEDIFNNLFPGAKKQYNKQMTHAVSTAPASLAPLPATEDSSPVVPASLPPLPEVANHSMEDLKTQNTINKTSTAASHSGVQLPSFVESGKTNVESTNIAPLTPADVARIRAANKGVMPLAPVDTTKVSNPNNNNVSTTAGAA